MSQEVRNQLHTIQTENLTPSQILSAAGGVYLSSNELGTQHDTQDIVKTFQAVKTPTLGSLIPNTCQIIARAGDSGIVPLFTPTANKSYALYAADVNNAGISAPLTMNIGFTNEAGDKFVALAAMTAGPAELTPFPIPGGVFFDSSAPLALLLHTGTAGDATVSVMIGEVVQ